MSAHTDLTLREILTQYPEHFYTQTWYADEPFLDVRWPLLRTLPSQIINPWTGYSDWPPSTSQLAFLYVCHPHADMWGRYLWCSDRDMHGQQIYVGTNGKGLEIHRHLHITSRWGIPSWT